MKKIAIFTSGEGECASRLVSLFNEGNRVRVDLVVTDRGDNRLVERMIQNGVNALYLPREVWQDNPADIIKLLNDNDITLLALDDFNGNLPNELEETYTGKIVRLTSAEEAPREIVEVLEPSGSDKPVETPVVPEIPKSVDEEWAEALKIKFDPKQTAKTPPPIPDVTPDSATPQPEYGQKPQQPQGVAAQGYVQQPYYASQQSTRGNSEPMPSTYLLWSILCTVLCCFIPGIVAIVFSSQVSSKYYAGDVEGSKRASRNAEVWIIVSFVLGLLSSTLYLPIMIFSH